MTTEKALVLLVPAFLICAAIITVLTEALKKAFKWSGTITSGIVSVIVPVAVAVAYCVLTGTVPNSVLAVFLLFLIFIAWIGSTLGFDKATKLLNKIREIIKGKKGGSEGDTLTVGEEKGNPDEEETDEKK